MPKRRIEFDQKQFVRSYLSGEHTVRGLAREFGFTGSFAHKIICGDRRPEIAEAIDRARHALSPARPEKKPLPDFFDDFPPLTPEEDDEALEEYLADDADPLDDAPTPAADRYARELTREDGLS
jgi:hypothetical protein